MKGSVGMKKVNILGTEYTIEEKEKNEMLGEDLGVCDIWDKKIILSTYLNKKTDPKQTDRIDLCKNKVLRHEILHALFFETGEWESVHNEELIDWIAIQYPKMQEIFTKLKIDK